MRLVLVELILILFLADCIQSRTNKLKLENSTASITELLNKLLTNYSKKLHPTFNLGINYFFLY